MGDREGDREHRINTFEEIGKVLLSAETVVIASHEGPEADAIGSSIALGLVLERLGKKTWIYNKDDIGGCKYLPGHEKVKNFLPDFTPDIFCAIDCATINRLGEEAKKFALRTTIVSIDHHGSGEIYGDYNLVIPDAPACGTIIFELFERMNWEITKDIATNLYAAIAKDTMCFLLHTVTPKTLKIASKLIELGADTYRVMKVVRYNTERKFKLLSVFLSRLRVKDKIAISYLLREDFRSLKANKDDAEDFIDHIRTMEGVDAAVFIREDGDEFFKISMRSEPHIDIGEIARRHGGGGHKNAAGFNMKGKLEDIITSITEEILAKIRDSTRI